MFLSAGGRRASIVVVLVVVISAGAACRRQAEPPPPPTPAPSAAPEPSVASASDAEQGAVQGRTLDFEKGERERAAAVADQRADLRRARVPVEDDASEVLTPAQRRLLEDRISKERGSRKNLLQEILDQDVRIRDMGATLEAMSKQVPASRVAAPGDRHDRIAMDFLLKQGVPADKAYQLISTLTLDDALVPGFRVWTYYNNGQFGTWVTQGTAAISPAERQKRLREEVENLRAESKALMDRASEYAKSNEVLLERATTGEAEAAAALKVAEKVTADAADRDAARANVVHYVIGTKKWLQKEKVIDGNLRLMTLDLPDSRALNLATTPTVTFEPGSYDPKMKRVKRIRLAPTTLVDGQDYSITSVDDVGVELRVLNTAKFLAAGKFLIVIE